MELADYLQKYDRLIVRWAKGDDDLAQDIRLAICKAWPRFDPDKGGFGTWAGYVAKDAIKARARKRCREPKTSEEPVDCNWTRTEDDIEQIIEQIDVAEQVATLRPCERKALFRTVFSAKKLSKTETDYVSRARKKLRMAGCQTGCQ